MAHLYLPKFSLTYLKCLCQNVVCSCCSSGELYSLKSLKLTANISMHHSKPQPIAFIATFKKTRQLYTIYRTATGKVSIFAWCLAIYSYSKSFASFGTLCLLTNTKHLWGVFRNPFLILPSKPFKLHTGFKLQYLQIVHRAKCQLCIVCAVCPPWPYK